MPGYWQNKDVYKRQIKSLIKAGASNPDLILDEIDKVSADR